MKKLVKIFKQKEPGLLKKVKNGKKVKAKEKNNEKTKIKEGFLAERRRFLKSKDRKFKPGASNNEVILEGKLRRKNIVPGFNLNITLLVYVFKYARFYSKQIKSLAEEEVCFELDKIPLKILEMLDEYSRSELLNEQFDPLKVDILYTF